MVEVPQEILAIQMAGIVAFYFETKWNNGDFFKKSSLLLWHWALVVKTFTTAAPGDVYRIPAAFTDVEALNLVMRKGQFEMLVDSLHTTKNTLKKARRKLVSRKRPDGPEGQGKLRLVGK